LVYELNKYDAFQRYAHAYSCVLNVQNSGFINLQGSKRTRPCFWSIYYKWDPQSTVCSKWVNLKSES